MGRVWYETERIPRYNRRNKNLFRGLNRRRPLLDSDLHRKMVDEFHPSTSSFAFEFSTSMENPHSSLCRALAVVVLPVVRVCAQVWLAYVHACQTFVHGPWVVVHVNEMGADVFVGMSVVGMSVVHSMVAHILPASSAVVTVETDAMLFPPPWVFSHA